MIVGGNDYCKVKVVNIIGGLGNQMFQYAFALSLKEHFPKEEIRIDISQVLQICIMDMN